MSLYNFYNERVLRFSQEEKMCEQRNSRYTWLRLFIIVAAIAAGICFYPVSAWLSVGSVVALLIIFAVCLKKHLANIEQQKQSARFRRLNQQEIYSLEGDNSSYAPGNQYINAKHYYTSDLDIFGDHSLFQYLNRTTSPSGSDMLSSWLATPASTHEIKERQDAVKELANMVDWRQNMQAVGLKYKSQEKQLPLFLEWLKSDAVLLSNRKMLHVMQVLPWVTLIVILLSSFGWVPSIFAWLLVAVHLVITGIVAKTVNREHQHVSNKVEFVSTYSELIGLFIYMDFNSSYLASLRGRFIDDKALLQINALQNCIRKLDYRLNMIYAPINILFFFDYKHLVWLEKWRLSAGQRLSAWFDAIARVEALSSFANIQFNHPAWVMPEVHDEYFTLEAREVGHPLILEQERVCNDFSLIGAGKVAIVTGSNMSGKSTFQRSIGVNMVLSLAGAPVCAASFIITNCQLYTYMRIADNLEERTSSFYAELKRLKQLIDVTRNGQHLFFLLDEVLRGTNSRDRQIGSMALVRQLARQQVSGVIATHDLALGDLEKEMPQNVYNSHFDVQINGEDMSFDYKLHPGICTSLNASILMRKIGIDVS